MAGGCTVIKPEQHKLRLSQRRALDTMISHLNIILICAQNLRVDRKNFLEMCAEAYDAFDNGVEQ